MGKKHLNWAKQQSAVSSPSRFVLWALADMADHSGHAWPSWRTLCEQTGLSKSAVYRALEELERAHLMRVTPRFKASGFRAGSSYQLLVDKSVDKKLVSTQGSPTQGPSSPTQGIHTRGSVIRSMIVDKGSGTDTGSHNPTVESSAESPPDRAERTQSLKEGLDTIKRIRRSTGL